MPTSPYNRTDNLKRQIRTEQTGGVVTSLSSGSGGLSGASYASPASRWVEDGVIYEAFIWGKSDFDSTTAIFV